MEKENRRKRERKKEERRTRTASAIAVAPSNHIQTLPDNGNLRCPRIRPIKKKFSPDELERAGRAREKETGRAGGGGGGVRGGITRNVNYGRSLHIPFYVSFAINGKR